MSSKKPWYKDGIRFQCQGSGNCCTSRGEYGYVYLNRLESESIARELGLTVEVFLKDYCEEHDDFLFALKIGKEKDCMFLKEKRCTIYKVRPTQCKTWPFWPENMNAKTWKKEIASYCPGVGQGPLRSVEFIDEQLKEQEFSETLR